MNHLLLYAAWSLFNPQQSHFPDKVQRMVLVSIFSHPSCQPFLLPEKNREVSSLAVITLATRWRMCASNQPLDANFYFYVFILQFTKALRGIIKAQNTQKNKMKI